MSFLRGLSSATLLAVGLSAVSAFAAEGPPLTASGAIGNETLTANQDVANAQAVGVITQFMSNGAKTCDENGQNCRSLFGTDDNLDYATLQMNTQSVTGIDSFSFMDEDNNTSSVSAQTASLVLVCGDTKAKTVAGIAVKASSCSVAANGSVSLTYQVCTGPSRGNPIEQADNAVLCSTDPAAPNFRPPDGMVCMRAACDSEPVGSLNGWSAPQTVTWSATLPSSATEDERAKNGLGLTFYPPLNGTVPASYTADSDNMSAVKVVQSFRNSSTNQTAVGLKVAYRHKAKVTKEMMTSGSAAVPNPGAHTAQWDTLLKLQGNALIPEYQAKYAKNGTECLQQIQSGIASDGVISVCDQEYVNESGIRPIERTAQVGVEGQECSTTEQCLREVVNTNTWTQTCRSDVPLAVRNCTTTTAYTTVDIHATRTRSQEICREKRTSAVYSCSTTADLGTGEPYWDPVSNLSYTGSTSRQTVRKDSRTFDVPTGAIVVGAEINSLHIDNWAEVRINGQRVWASLSANLKQVLDENTYDNCDNETWTETTTQYDYDYETGEYTERQVTVTRRGVRCTLTDGRRVRANFSDDCIWHCDWDGRYTVSIPIPVDLIRRGPGNVVETACFNNEGPSACNVAIRLQFIPWEALIITNACSGYEAAI